MKLKTTRLGIPLHMWRIMIWPLTFSLLIYIGCNAAFIAVMYIDAVMDVILRGPIFLGFMIVPLLAIVFIGVVSQVIFKKAFKYRKRFQEHKGLLCFRCDYDLYEGQRACPECGALWEPNKLRSGWQHMMKHTNTEA